MSRISGGGAIVQEDAIRDRTQLSVAATAFGLSAAVSILFNTALACVKDAYPPVFRFMAALTGHHWITQGLADLILFLVLGFALMLAGAKPDDITARRFQRTRFIRDGDGCRRLNAHDLVRDKGHF